MVEPAAEAAARSTKNGLVGLIGTQATIRSGAYERRIAAEAPGVRVLSRACPLFVPLVENGRFRPGDVVAETVATEYLEPFQDAGVDTLVLGCTHYPLLTEVIGNCMGPGVTLVNVGEKCACRVAERLGGMAALAEPGRRGESRYYVSDSVEDFSRLASIFLRQDVAAEVTQVDIWRY